MVQTKPGRPERQSTLNKEKGKKNSKNEKPKAKKIQRSEKTKGPRKKEGGVGGGLLAREKEGLLDHPEKRKKKKRKNGEGRTIQGGSVSLRCKESKKEMKTSLVSRRHRGPSLEEVLNSARTSREGCRGEKCQWKTELLIWKNWRNSEKKELGPELREPSKVGWFLPRGGEKRRGGG